MVNISVNINKRNNNLSPQIIEHKRQTMHDMWCLHWFVQIRFNLNSVSCNMFL